MTIGNQAFDSKKITSVIIPDTVTVMSSYCFRGCKNLTSVSIPDSVVELGTESFSNCTALEYVKLSNKISKIGDYAFNSCKSLTEIIIPTSVKTIGGRAFQSCSGLSSVTIPSNVNTIESSAFNGCTGLKSLTLEEGLQVINSNAFYGCSSLVSVTVPSTVTSIFDSSFNCKNLKEITILNPTCTFEYNSAISNGDNSVIIYGAEDSTAQAYAEKNNYTFQSISSKPRKGDMNSDGLVDSVDGSVILGYYAYLSTKPEDEVAMDIDEYQASQQ